MTIFHLRQALSTIGIFAFILISQTTGFERTLDAKGKYLVIWDVDFESQAVHFELVVETQGYVGFGLSEDGRMEGVDLMLAQRINGSLAFEDYHGVETSVRPVVDRQQDWILTMAATNKTHTTLKFHRAFDTEDDDDVVIDNKPLYLIWSYSPRNNPVFEDQVWDASSGSVRLNILHPDLELEKAYAPFSSTSSTESTLEIIRTEPETSTGNTKEPIHHRIHETFRAERISGAGHEAETTSTSEPHTTRAEMTSSIPQTTPTQTSMKTTSPKTETKVSSSARRNTIAVAIIICAFFQAVVLNCILS